jgi:2-dehydro-3-deoxygalactonokinase
MIGIDWGTTTFRAYRLGAGAEVREKRAAPLGILSVEGGRFAEALERETGDWIAAGEAPIVMSGMIGSRQGWEEAPYVSCPAGAAEIAQQMQRVMWGAGREAWIAPGLSSRDATGVPDVMRGEETQLLGVLDELPAHGAQVCLPGTHSKWVYVQDKRIQRFSTYMTGELYAVMSEHSILARTMVPGSAIDAHWFQTGVRRAQDAGGLLHHLFGVRARTLFGELPGAAATSYLSGLVVGHELGAAQPGTEVWLLGDPELVELYRQGLELFGCAGRALDPDSAVRGLARLADHLPSRTQAC